jgi:hypothetical protein
VPFVVVRAVGDTASETLPLDFNRCRDASGRIRRSRVVGRSLLRPGVLPSLWRLRRRVALCAENLARVVPQLLARAWA